MTQNELNHLWRAYEKTGAPPAGFECTRRRDRDVIETDTLDEAWEREAGTTIWVEIGSLYN
jgi:hypothetical protein